MRIHKQITYSVFLLLTILLFLHSCSHCNNRSDHPQLPEGASTSTTQQYPLHEAIHSDNLEALTCCLENIKNADEIINQYNNDEHPVTPLQAAIIHRKKPEVIQLLLDHGADVNLSMDGFGKYLQNDSGKKIPRKDLRFNDRLTALALAIYQYDRDEIAAKKLLAMLLKHGNHSPWSCYQALLVAVDKGNIELLTLLLADKNNKIDINYHDANVDRTPPVLFKAIQTGKENIVKWLLENVKNINVNIRTNDRWCPTPLHEAIHHRNINIIQLLLTHGADKTAVNQASKKIQAPYRRSPLLVVQAAYLPNGWLLVLYSVSDAPLTTTAWNLGRHKGRFVYLLSYKSRPQPKKCACGPSYVGLLSLLRKVI
eukprot:gene59-85_t